MTRRTRLWSAQGAAVGAEFAMVLPLLIVLIVGVVDVGRFMWTWNRAEKATQMGVRYAAVTDMGDTVRDDPLTVDVNEDAGIWTYDFYTAGGIPRGDAIPEAAFGGATCTASGCTCIPDTLPCGSASAAFTSTVARMQAFMAEIQPENVTIEYGYSGLGYSGDPYGSDVNPLITIKLGQPTPISFEPALGYLLGFDLTLPSFASTLPMEDGIGSISN
jgi:hypothetical protein